MSTGDKESQGNLCLKSGWHAGLWNHSLLSFLDKQDRDHTLVPGRHLLYSDEKILPRQAYVYWPTKMPNFLSNICTAEMFGDILQPRKCFAYWPVCFFFVSNCIWKSFIPDSNQKYVLVYFSLSLRCLELILRHQIEYFGFKGVKICIICIFLTNLLSSRSL